MNTEDHSCDLIVTIVPKGLAERALRASQEAGAEGGTIIYGRGTGVHEKRKILGVPIEPEKEILLTVVSRAISQTVLDNIYAAARLDVPGGGIAFTMPLDRVVGICHLNSCRGTNQTPSVEASGLE